MNRFSQAVTVMTVLSVLAGTAMAEGKLGQAAPALKIEEWVKGKPADVSKDGVFVVEFWATWCGPCIQSIPHLTEMQKKFGEKVTFIGVSDEKVSTVRPFVERMGDKMDYVVAVDKGRETYKAYMNAFGIEGIPHAFIVQNGKIVWHDHPMGIEDVLDKVADGKFDDAAARELKEARERRDREMREMSEWFGKYFELVRSTGQEEEADRLAERIIATKHAQFLNAFSWRILTMDGIQHRDLKSALKAAEIANEETKNKDASIIDTYALALFENGRKKEALEHQRRAVKLAEEGGLEGLLGELKERLERYENEQ